MTDTAVDVQQLLLFSVNACVYPPAPPLGYIPASLTGGFKKSPGQVMLAWPPHLQGIVDSQEPSRLVFSMRKSQVSWSILETGTGWKGGRIGSCCGHRVAAGLWKGERKALSSRPCTHFTPTSLGFQAFASRPLYFCRKNCWTLFLYR